MASAVFLMLWAPLITAGLSACASAPQGSVYGPEIAAAETAVERARHAGFVWSQTEALLQQAKSAARQGHAAQSVELARQASTQGELAVNQYYLERAKHLRSSLSQRELTAEQRKALADADKQIRKSEGKASFDLVSSVGSEVGLLVGEWSSAEAGIADASAQTADDKKSKHGTASPRRPFGGRPAWQNRIAVREAAK